MDNLQSLKTKRVRKLLHETEATLTELKDELARRQLLKANEEISHIDEHIDNAESSLKSIRDFLAYLTKDLIGNEKTANKK